MLQILLNLLPSALSTINGITGAIANAKIAAINAKTAEEQIQANENVLTLQAQRDLMIADGQKSNLDIYIRTAIAGPVAFILGKIWIYDKCLGWGRTDILPSDPLWNVIMVVIGFYFLHSIVGMFKK